MLLLGSLSGQDHLLETQHWGIGDGLLHRSVKSVFEDQTGYIWLASPVGVQRFDGHEFKSWTKANTDGLVQDIKRISQDQAGLIWFDLKAIYDPSTDKLMATSAYFPDGVPITWDNTANTGWTPPPSETFKKDSKGRFLFLSSQPNRLYIYDASKGFSFLPLDQLPEDFTELYFVDSQDHLWVSSGKTNAALYEMDLKGNILQVYNFPNNYDINKFSEQRTGVQFSVSFDNATRSDYYISGPGHTITKLGETTSDTDWHSFGTTLLWKKFGDHRFEVYEPGQKTPKFILDENNYRKELFAPHNSFLEDSKGNVWLGNDLGLHRIATKPSSFKPYFSFQNNEPKTFINATRGIEIYNDSIYVSCEASGLLRAPISDPEHWEFVVRYPHAVAYDRRPLFFDQQETLIVGDDSKLTRYLPNGKPLGELYPARENPDLSLGKVWSLFQDKQGILWVGGTYELSYLEPGKDSLQRVTDNRLVLRNSNKQKTILHLSDAPEGKLWLATFGALYLFDPVTKSYLKRFNEGEKGDQWLPASNFYYQYTDPQGILWLGTDEGLVRWDRAQQEIRLFTQLDGLSNNVIYAIVEDDYNHLWLSSDYGIMQFDKETYKVRAYLEKDGISHHEFNRTSSLQGADGTIYFGGLNGVTAFHPKDFYNREETEDPPLVLTSFRKFDEKSRQEKDLTAALNNTKTITFQPTDRYFRIKFALLTYEDVSRLNYAYRIKGVDENWNYQVANTLQLSKLPYGSHRLLIKGQDGSGRWSTRQLEYTLNVIKPVYLRTWFLVLVLGLAIAGAWLFYRQRTLQLIRRQKALEEAITSATKKIAHDKKTIEQQAEDLRKLDKLKSRFFANVSHELRTPLSLMLGPIRRLRQRNDQEQEEQQLLGFLERNTVHLKDLVNEILDLSKLENNRLELQPEPTSLLSYINNHLSQFYSIGNSDNVLVESELMISDELRLMIDKKKFEKIVNNFLSNAIKFTPPTGRVLFSAKEEEDTILVSVKDNGRGISATDLPYVFDRFYQSKDKGAPAEGGTGIGLSMSRELAELMKGKVWAESTLGEGSIFYFRFPKQESKASPLPVEEFAGAAGAKEGLGAMVKAPAVPGKHILIVEDNADLREYYQILLSDYTLTLAENGRSALDYLAGGKLPDLIISDLMMPVMDGMQLLALLKASDNLRHLPVIMLTAKTNQQVKIEALRHGIDDYLNKPFDDDEFQIRITNILLRQEERKVFLQEESDNDAKPTLAAADLNWLKEVEAFIFERLESPDLSIRLLSQAFSMSESTLLRQIKRLTGLTPNKYLQELRLSQAREFILSNEYRSISEVAYQVGFKDPAAFSRSFRKRFGKAPTEIAT